MRARHSPVLAFALALAIGAPGALSCAGARAKPAPAPPAADRSQVPVPGPAPALRLPRQEHFQLANGLKVRLVERHELPIVALHLVVDAGAVHDPANRPGLASFTAAMMTEGTKRRSATRISDDLGFIGASLEAGASFDSASLLGAALSAHLGELLDIFADVLVNPTFPRGDFRRVQDQRLVALLQQRAVPGAAAARAFAHLFWGDHPYGHWLPGTEVSVKATRREDLVRFHAARWRPDVSELVVVGDVTPADLRGKLEKALAGWKGKAAASLAAVEPSASAPPTPRGIGARRGHAERADGHQPPRLQTLLLAKRGAPQAYVLMGMPGLPRSSPDYVAAEVAFQVLGGGTSSRIFRDLREKRGYTYGMYSRVEARKLGGASIVVGSVKESATGAALKELLQQMADLREKPVSQGELEVARNALLLSLPADFASAAGIAGKLAEEVVYRLPDDYWDGFAAQVAHVSADDVRRVAERYLDTSRLTTVLVCDAGEVRPQLEGLPLGPIEVRRAAPPPARTQPAEVEPAAAR
jgi:zinc protease